MNCEDDQAGENCAETKDSESFLWRPWPCPSCCGRATPFSFLLRSLRSDPPGSVSQGASRNEIIDSYKIWESQRLVAWVETCDHSEWKDLTLPRLDEGSEHLVLYDADTTEVVKITRPGTFGDYYEIIDGKIHQFDSRPIEYMLRMMGWEKLFSAAPSPVGMTKCGRIVSRQRFILGKADPPQEEVDQFLEDAGVIAVRQRCWLWKKEVGPDVEVWIGDARSDNFVHAEEGIVPIDIRLWGVVKEDVSSDNQSSPQSL